MSTNNPGTENIPNQGHTLITVSKIFLFVTTIFFATRLIWRLSNQQRGWDDLMATLAYTTLVIQTSFGYMATHYGFGKHRVDIPHTFSRARFWFWLYQICYKLLGGFTKLNFCFLYLRIFEGTAMRRFPWLVWGTAGITAAGTMAFTIATVGQCVPVKRNWDHSVQGYCISYMAFWFSHAAFNTVMDIVVYILPIPLIQHLQIARRTKSGLFAIFALGAFTIAASITRMAMLPHSANSTADPTWGSMTALVWTEVEANTAVICCCLPALRVVAVRLWRRIIGKTGDENTPTPTPRPNPVSKSKGWAWSGSGSGSGGMSKTFGTVTEARYSPQHTGNDDEHEQAQQAPIERRVLPSSTCFDSPSGMAAGWKSPSPLPSSYQTAPPPQLELPGLGIYKTTQLQMNTNRESKYEMPRVKRDITSKRNMSPKPEPVYEPIASAGRGGAGAERSMTLKEMLDEGPPAPGLPRWR